MQQQGDQQGNENPFLNNLSKGREGQLRKKDSNKNFEKYFNENFEYFVFSFET